MVDVRLKEGQVLGELPEEQRMQAYLELTKPWLFSNDRMSRPNELYYLLARIRRLRTEKFAPDYLDCMIDSETLPVQQEEVDELEEKTHLLEWWTWHGAGDYGRGDYTDDDLANNKFFKEGYTWEDLEYILSRAHVPKSVEKSTAEFAEWYQTIQEREAETSVHSSPDEQWAD